MGQLASGVPEEYRSATAVGMLLAITVGLVTRPDEPLQFDRETHQRLLHFGPLRWSLVNGGLLGLGITSRVGYWLWYVVPVGTWGVGSWWAGGAIWGLYGFGRLAATGVLAGTLANGLVSESQLSRSLLETRRALARPVARFTAIIVGVQLMAAGL